MKDQRGYVFIELIIIILVISSTMLAFYSSYRNITIKEKTQLYYDDVASIYKAYILTNNILDNTNIRSFNWDNNYYYDLSKEIVEGSNIYNVANILVFSPSFFKNNRQSNDDSILSTYGGSLNRYIHVLNINSDNYIFIIKYRENKDGTKCIGNDDCVEYYTWFDSGVKYE